MHLLIGIIILAALIIIAGGLYSVFKTKISFYVTGLDAKFSIFDLNLLWKVAQLCELENPMSLFYSAASLNRCMSQISSQTSANGKASDPSTQNLLTKLFNYRTKLQNESDDKKGLDSTHSLDKGQKLRIILPGKGVFVSEVLNCGKEIIVSVPRQKDLIPIPAQDWVGKVVNVYLWRKGDARYVFDTTVLGNGLFIGESSISLQHSNNLIRTQKRKAVRAKCNINAKLYIIKDEVVDYNVVETHDGYKCLIEDISEAGALVRIGGKGVQNVQIKLQFPIQSMLIIMFGVVRTVEFNEAENQSLLHFECVHIDTAMKNEVLKYVYDMLPQNEKEVYDALTLTDADEKAEDGEVPQELEKVDSVAPAEASVPVDVTNPLQSDFSNSEDSEKPVENPEDIQDDTIDIF